MNKELLNEINAAYYHLEAKKTEIVQALLHRIFQLESGWYNGHYHKSEDGDWERESYPIPVVGVKGICDIEIQFDKITVSAKMKRDMALTYFPHMNLKPMGWRIIWRISTIRDKA